LLKYIKIDGAKISNNPHTTKYFSFF